MILPLTRLALPVTLFVSLNACATTFPPSYISTQLADYRYPDPFSIHSKADVAALQSAKWDFSFDLYQDGKKKMTVDNCQALIAALKKGMKGEDDPSNQHIFGTDLNCRVNEELLKLGEAQGSFVRGLPLDESFARLAPAALGMQISNEDKAKAKSAKSWNAFSQIKKVDKINDHEAVFYDGSGGIQHLSVLATGDYNGDGIEDLVVNLNNSVEGGSFDASYAFILTRRSKNAPLELLKVFKSRDW
ncbi:hypothetical protein PVT67_13210 [Gallaecimonas kandeliae]|uniref:hypothetical protein n=1 Tax=Gallaecimonas kandeliae TaxID=3029055 RepID=UPI00264947FE|nr:hypothetical protein [Gallaecimonas kandeliae]WKE64621.1 hypothetical protein PVT67_13210 [Gallaecimonas kandeliae]